MLPVIVHRFPTPAIILWQSEELGNCLTSKQIGMMSVLQYLFVTMALKSGLNSQFQDLKVQRKVLKSFAQRFNNSSYGVDLCGSIGKGVAGSFATIE